MVAQTPLPPLSPEAVQGRLALTEEEYLRLQFHYITHGDHPYFAAKRGVDTENFEALFYDWLNCGAAARFAMVFTIVEAPPPPTIH